jgi:Flp pilus assembly protein TadD
MNRRILFPLALVALCLLGSCARPLASGALTAGVAAAERGDWEEAARQWTKVVARNPGSASAHNNLAVAFERRGAWEDARREYETALRLDPDNRTIRENRDALKAHVEPGLRRTP